MLWHDAGINVERPYSCGFLPARRREQAVLQQNVVGERLAALGLSHATDYFEKDKIIDLRYDTPNLYSEIDMCVRDYQNKNAMNRIHEGYSYNYWTQDYIEGDVHSEHHHNVGQISGVYYVRANENAGGISFRNPNPFTEYGHTMRDTAPYSWQEYVYQPIKGRILMFPSYLKHQVLPSKKDCVRTVIAFNVR